jgi:replicative DNA helicase
MMLYREDYYDTDSGAFEEIDEEEKKKTEGLTKLFVRKNRSGPV